MSNNIPVAVWANGDTVQNNDPAKIRKDQCGAWIIFSEYGKRNTEFGWEEDHITPQANGGSDELSNLRPLHWKNNAKTQDGRLTCPVIAKGTNNIGWQ